MAIERYAWTVFLGLGVILALFGIGDFVTGAATYGQGESAAMRAVAGVTWDQLRATSPAGAAMLDFSTREDALNELLIGLFGAALGLSAVRRGEWWAWYAMWIWPL